ncbi:MAG: cobalamin-binding protein [Clostridiaceae bacterium]|nr:cobalamin-binding protein [Clostridiaceae bacterium]
MYQKKSKIVYAFIKPEHDAHTLGIQAAADLLRSCDYQVIVADKKIEKALFYYKEESARREIISWLRTNGVTRLGITYRLDKQDALNIVGYIIHELKNEKMLIQQGGPIDAIFFGGLPEACQLIENEFPKLVHCFQGGESAHQTLLSLGIPENELPPEILEVNQYDENRNSFAKEIIDKKEYKNFKSHNDNNYPDYGSRRDNLIKRLKVVKDGHFGKRPLTRAHVGPYTSGQKHQEAIREACDWIQKLAQSGYLDILSLGTSQLSQSNFGENWTGMNNGGGVPVNSPEEYIELYEASRPLLMRTYAGTKNIRELAELYEKTINICWHAMSIWWFNRLDGRGPYTLFQSLKEQINAIRYVAKTGKPFEANVSHHFSFRGADDITYIVSAYLAAKLAKKLGIKTFVLQNMLNTPSSTWGIQDLAKSRVLLRLIRSLEDKNFTVLFQPRAGLDYFVADPYKAKIQLAAVSCLMDDIEANNSSSPEIIHVVSYSEASHLATPDIVNESIQITLHTIKEYRKARKQGLVDDMSQHEEINERANELYSASLQLINYLEKSIPNIYSAEGFYTIFAAGFLPVPYLWNETKEFSHAINWQTKSIQGAMTIVDQHGRPMSMDERIELASSNLNDANFALSRQL